MPSFDWFPRRYNLAVKELSKVRSSISLASAVLASVLLAACSSGSAPTIPGSQPAADFTHRPGAHAVAIVPDHKNRCPSSAFTFCVDISPSSSGPYWDWCGNASCSGAAYDLVATDSIAMTKSGKNMDKQLPSSWAPSPGNPSENYITEHKVFAPSPNPKFTETSQACYYYDPSDCSSVTVGLIPSN
jgi:hypothetical protein